MGSTASTTGSKSFHNRYVLGKDKCEGSSRFLRIKIPNGKLTAEKFQAIAGLADKYGRGYAEITDRQNIQLHWIEEEKALEIFSKLDSIGFSTDHGGQGIPTAQKGDVRAIVSCPAAGIDQHELVDTWPIVKQLDSFFNGNTDFLDLPRKLKIAVSGCSLNCGNPEINDLSFVAVKEPSGEIGFAVLVGGTIATAPELGRPLGVVVKPEEILDVVRCTAEIFRDFGNRETKAKARFRWLVDAWGTEKLRATLEQKMGKMLQNYPLEHLPTSKGEHSGVQPQKQKGFSYVNIPIVSGILSSEKMLKIAQIAKKHGNGDLRLTAFQNIILANIPDQAVNQALQEIEGIGYTATDNYLKWSTIACAGNFCGKTLDHPKKRAAEALDYLEKRFGDKLASVKVCVGFSGCPNGCARHLIADVGLQGSAAAFEGKSVPAYNIYIRDTTVAEPVLGKLIQRGIRAEQAKTALANLIEAYLKNQANISFSEFCNTKTVEQLQVILNSNLNQNG